MKKIIVFCLLFTISAATFSQETTAKTPLTKTDYLNKSKNQKTAAWIVLGGGVVLVSAGVAIGFNEATNAIVDIFSLEQPKNSNTGEVLFYTGLVSMAGSIPLFIASSRNKKKAMNLSTSLKMETRSVIQQQAFARASYPALALKLSL